MRSGEARPIGPTEIDWQRALLLTVSQYHKNNQITFPKALEELNNSRISVTDATRTNQSYIVVEILWNQGTKQKLERVEFLKNDQTKCIDQLVEIVTKRVVTRYQVANHFEPQNIEQEIKT